MNSRIPTMKTTAFFVLMFLTALPSGVVSAQQKPVTGYAPVIGLKMYYEIHGEGVPADKTRAAGYYKRACDHGDTEACDRLATLTATPH